MIRIAENQTRIAFFGRSMPTSRMTGIPYMARILPWIIRKGEADAQPDPLVGSVLISTLRQLPADTWPPRWRRYVQIRALPPCYQGQSEVRALICQGSRAIGVARGQESPPKYRTNCSILRGCPCLRRSVRVCCSVLGTPQRPGPARVGLSVPSTLSSSQTPRSKNSFRGVNRESHSI